MGRAKKLTTVGLLCLLLQAPAAASAAGKDSECTSDSDCYGGRCLPSGECVCPPLWASPNCQTLRVKPARASAPGLMLRDTSTWGGTAVQGADGLYHMFAARMVARCGLRSWHNAFNGTQVANSDIVHATAPTPDGPYTVVETVLNTFAHGPQASVLPDGRFAVVHLGCGNHTLPELTGCINGSTPGIPGVSSAAHHSLQQQRPPGLSNCDWPAWTGVLLQGSTPSSSSWTQLADWAGPGLVVDGGANAWHINTTNSSAHADNPSFWPLENGTVLLAYASKMKSPSTSKHKHIGMAVGELPLSGGSMTAFRDISSAPIFPYEAEDPTIWLDTTNNLTDMRWHIFAHRLVSDINPPSSVCAHAVASSPYGPWKVAATGAYNTTIEWASAGGEDSSPTVTQVQGRERPHIIFSRAGHPVALSTGVTPGPHATPVTPHGYTGDFSYTHVQLFDPR